MNELPMLVIDTNVILRHLLNDHAEHSPRASALFLRVRRGEEPVFCPDTAIFEAVYILHGLAKAPRDSIVAALLAVVELPSFRMDHKAAIRAALRFWQEQPALDYADCYHLTLTREMELSGIYTFDRKMERFPGVERVEP